MTDKLAKELRKQLKNIIEYGDVEDMKDALRYLAGISIREAEESIKAVDEAMRKEA